MPKDIDIDYKIIKLLRGITIDGVPYPCTGRNTKIVQRYQETGDEGILDKLVGYDQRRDRPQ